MGRPSTPLACARPFGRFPALGATFPVQSRAVPTLRSITLS